MTNYLVLTLPRPDALASAKLNDFAAVGWRVVAMTGGDRVVTVILAREGMGESR